MEKIIIALLVGISIGSCGRIVRMKHAPELVENQKLIEIDCATGKTEAESNLDQGPHEPATTFTASIGDKHCFLY